MLRWTALLVCASLAPCPTVVAQEALADPLAEGLRLRQEGRDAAAADFFEGAYEASHSARALAQLALAEQALGRWAEAATHLTDALTREDDPWIAAHRETLAAALETIRGNVGELSIDANVDGAEVIVNGAPAGATPLARVISATGTAVVELRAPGYVPVQRSATVRAGALTRVHVVLVPEARAEPTGSDAPADPLRAAATSEATGARPPDVEPGSPSPLLVAGIAVAAGALLAAGATLAAVGVREDNVQHWNDDDRCPPTLPMGRSTQCADVYSTWRTAEDWAIAGAVVTGALLLTGAVLIALGLADGGASSGEVARHRGVGLRVDAAGARLVF